MDTDRKIFRNKQAAEQIDSTNGREQSHLVHHVGPVGTGLFPGWGPKL